MTFFAWSFPLHKLQIPFIFKIIKELSFFSENLWTLPFPFFPSSTSFFLHSFIPLLSPSLLYLLIGDGNNGKRRWSCEEEKRRRQKNIYKIHWMSGENEKRKIIEFQRFFFFVSRSLLSLFSLPLSPSPFLKRYNKWVRLGEWKKRDVSNFKRFRGGMRRIRRYHAK